MTARESAERVLGEHSVEDYSEGEYDGDASLCCCCHFVAYGSDLHDAAIAHRAHVAERLDAAGVLGGSAETLRKAARFFEYDMSEAWGGDSSWISTGNHVADLVADILRERADELAEHRGERDGGAGC